MTNWVRVRNVRFQLQLFLWTCIIFFTVTMLPWNIYIFCTAEKVDNWSCFSMSCSFLMIFKHTLGHIINFSIQFDLYIAISYQFLNKMSASTSRIKRHHLKLCKLCDEKYMHIEYSGESSNTSKIHPSAEGSYRIFKPSKLFSQRL